MDCVFLEWDTSAGISFDILESKSRNQLYYRATSSFKILSRQHNETCWRFLVNRENTKLEKKNAGFCICFEAGSKKSFDYRVFVLGSSQAFLATRWIAKYKIDCQHLILHSGGIPEELKREDFEHLSKSCKILYLYGNQDPYITGSAQDRKSRLKVINYFIK